MKPIKEFYDDLHKDAADYGAGTYHMGDFWSCRPIRRWLESKKGGAIRIADVGCGKGVFIRDFVQGAEKRGLKADRVVGLDLVRSPNDLFAQVSPKFEFIQADSDGKALPLADGSIDFISCNHVLEHVFETEFLVKQFRRVLAKDGLCIIATPNIACWFNRVAFLWGCQPLGSELGTEATYYGFRPAFLGERLKKFPPSGHIRDFTPHALKDLTAHCGFETVGWWKQTPGFVARLGKWAGRNIAIVLQPKG